MVGPRGPATLIALTGLIWLTGLAKNLTPLAPVRALIIVTGIAATWTAATVWRTRLTYTERQIIRRWEDTCATLDIANPPTICRKPNGRLDYRKSAASLTLKVQLHVIPEPHQPDGRVRLKTLTAFARLGEEFKVAIGGDVCEVRIHARTGNRATVVIVTEQPGYSGRLKPREVRTGYDTAIAVLTRQPNKAWVYHAEFGGYVLAQHRHAVEYLPDGDEDEPDWLELDDDEAAAWWVNTDRRRGVAIAPRSRPLFGGLISLLERQVPERYVMGEGSGSASPPPWIQIPPDPATRAE